MTSKILSSADIKDGKARQLLESFGLLKYFPGKITIQIARQKTKLRVREVHDIPWYFIGKLLSVLGQGWYDFNLLDKRKSEKHKVKSAADFDFDSDDESEEIEEEKSYDIRDVKVAVFLCSDNILKKILAQKLYFSHLSVPFVLPDVTRSEKLELHWWCFRGMRADFDFANAPGQLVSVIRFTDLPISRTEVLNRLLFDKSHDTFFKEREKSIDTHLDKFSWTNGLIEVGTYRPSKCCCSVKDECTCPFNELVSFFYLHGNCKDLPLHKKLVCALSTLVTIIVDVALLTDDVVGDIINVVSQAAKTLIVFTKDDKFPNEDARKRCKELIDRLKEKQLADDVAIEFLYEMKKGSEGAPFDNEKIQKVMRGTIKGALTTCSGIKSLKKKYDDLGMAEFICDDDEISCKSGEDRADLIRSKIKRGSLVRIKETKMPLQSNQWVKWSATERAMRSGKEKSDNETQEEFLQRMKSKKDAIRAEQVATYRQGQSEIMKIFCDTLTNYERYPRLYFLGWLKIFLQDISSQEIQRHRQDLASLPMTDGIEEKEKELREKIANISFDLRHFFREVGQIVEACMHSQDSELKRYAEKLSKVIASLFIQGVSLEILDSDAKQVPIKFLTSVFENVQKQVREQVRNVGKVFVLSVLGIQSSGKSTLLNVMFGTQFATSIGLCTEGVNVQLIPIPAEHKSNGYEFILLLDTKGLLGTDRDLRDPHSGDNELATLLFGLSDLTLVNVKGSAKTTIENILQVITHAILKIKQVNQGLRIQPRCIFLHQNVDEACAKESLSNENAQFKDKLDDIVRNVAGKMGVSDVTRFSDVIKFDITEDTVYFPNLWKGSPPMATVNSGYNQKVSESLNIIFDRIMPKTGYQADMNGFSIRLKDIWNAILGTNFILSFRNHLEINAFATLHDKFNNLRWNLNAAVTTIFNQLKDKNDKSLEEQKESIEILMNPEWQAQNTDLVDFFDATSEGSFLLDLKQKYLDLLKILAGEKVDTVMMLLKREKEVEKRKEEARPQLQRWKEDARIKAIVTAKKELEKGESTREKSEKKIEVEFNELWDDLLASLPKIESKINLQETVKSVIRDVGNLLPAQISGINFQSSRDDEFEVTQGHFHVLSNAKIPTEFNIRDTIKGRVTLNILQDANDYLVKHSEHIFDKSHVEQAMQIALRHIRKWDEDYPQIQLTDAYKISILTHIGKVALPCFESMEKAYAKRVDASLDEFKEQIRYIHRDTIKKIAKEQTAADLLFNQIKAGIKERVDRELRDKLPEDIRKFNHFMVSKEKFGFQIMEDVLQKDTFEEYLSYLENTDAYSERRLKHHVNTYLFIEKKMYFSNSIGCAEKIVEKVNQVISVLIKQHKLSPASANNNFVMEIQNLVKLLSQSLPYMKNTDVFQNIVSTIGESGYDDVIFFQHLETRSKALFGALKADYHNVHCLDPDLERHVIQKLLEYLQGCTKKCPFCSVTCSNPMKGHPHGCYSELHYPIGLNGGIRSTKETCLETCNMLVASELTVRINDMKMKVPWGKKIMNFFLHGSPDHNCDIVPFKDYQKVYKDWMIDGSKIKTGSKYWKRFLVKFGDRLAQHHRRPSPDIPKGWKEYTNKSVVIQAMHSRDGAYDL